MWISVWKLRLWLRIEGEKEYKEKEELLSKPKTYFTYQTVVSELRSGQGVAQVANWADRGGAWPYFWALSKPARIVMVSNCVVNETCISRLPTGPIAHSDERNIYPQTVLVTTWLLQHKYWEDRFWRRVIRNSQPQKCVCNLYDVKF